MSRIAVSLAAALAAAAISTGALAGPAASPTRADFTDVVRELRRIVTPDGIHQFVSIRGADRRNPVLLILHGGPGFPTMPMAWMNTRGLEEYFTVVHWDQRGSIAPYAAPGKPIALKDIALERKWSDYFGGVMAYRHAQVDGKAIRLSPDYTDAEAAHVYDGNDYSERFLFSPVLALDFKDVKALACPLLVLAGRHDHSVNSDVARAWFDSVHAPHKEFVWFENSAHEIMTEEPGKLLLTLVQKARPLAAAVGDAAP